MADKKKGAYDPVNLGTEAASRFTRTPMRFTIDDFIDRLLTKISGDPEPHTSGSFRHNPPQIVVHAYSNNPDYSDLANTIHHEDIHALLNKVNFQYPPENFNWPSYNAALAMRAGDRMGNPQKEIPAYVGAYQPDQLPGFTAEDRQKYLSSFYPRMSPETAKNLQRIIENYNASQK